MLKDTEPGEAPLKQRTLVDVYEGRLLTEAQVRRLVVLLRLTEPRTRSEPQTDAA